ncbi:hypothetical protein TSAR_006497 [Trichomalopsis sarcophagae]|uniref:Large ribosomal subunit protein uL18m n=1 Tax=Trichomalopsis sarcophagae TaxID=543379 RepID=A0A232ER20_9HYME|nr:hypothetical protein TSAR_006497 [Trichomalopsis sarcophagae]
MNTLSRGSSFALKSQLGNVRRQVQSNASLLENCSELNNRNPRNLEFMRIARKPEGYHLNNPGNEYWNKLYVESSNKHVEAGIRHFKNGPVITASTREWALKKQLFKTHDVAAFANIGKLLAQRCLECGITSVRCDIDATNSTRYTALLNALKENGLELEEPPQYKHANSWDTWRMLKPWTVQE